MSDRKDIMLATMFTEKRFNALPKPVLVQPKIEGDRLRDVMKNGLVDLLTSCGNRRTSVPHIYEELATSSLDNIELDGELYRHGMRHSEIRSIVSRTKNLHPDFKRIQYHVFDIVDTERIQLNRTTDLENLFYATPGLQFIKLVPTIPITTLEELQLAYNYYLRQGYEGIIIRHPYAKYIRRKVSTIMKLKPRVSEYFIIVGVEEEMDLAGERKGTFGAFNLITEEGQPFNAGSGPTAYQRVLLWQNRSKLIGTKVKIRFQGYTKIRQVPKLLSIDKEWLVNYETNI
jgi:ATP-dependent DNA ligase